MAELVICRHTAHEMPRRTDAGVSVHDVQTVRDLFGDSIVSAAGIA